MILFLILTFVLGFCKKKSSEPVKVEEPTKNYFSTQWVNFWVAKLEYAPEQKARLAEAKKLNSKAFALYKSKKDKEAVELYEKSIDSYPLGETYYNYGNSLSNIDRLEDSILAYKIALHLNAPRPELVLYNTACSHSRLNQVEEAYSYLAKAIDRGYNAISYIEKDPDMANLRKDSRWESKIQELVNSKQYNNEDLAGQLKISYRPRGGDEFILCSSGVAITPIDPFSGIGGACGDRSAFENTQYMYKIGRWKLTNGDLEITFEKECSPDIIQSSRGDASTMGCQGLAGTPKFKKCSDSISSGNSDVTFSKDKVSTILANDSKDMDTVYELNKNYSEPKQCDPNFIPKTLDDLKLE